MLYKVVATAEKACLPRPIIYNFSAIYNGASWNDWKRWSIVLAGHCLKLYSLFFQLQSDIKYCCHCSFCDCVSWAWYASKNSMHKGNSDFVYLKSMQDNNDSWTCLDFLEVFSHHNWSAAVKLLFNAVQNNWSFLDTKSFLELLYNFSIYVIPPPPPSFSLCFPF